MQEQPEKRRRGLRLVLILGTTTLATLAIGFGGLAAWTVTTQNSGSTFQTGTVHHTNTATFTGSSTGDPATPSVDCNDINTLGPCGAIFTITNAAPGDSGGGTLNLISTGSLDSTFVVTSAGGTDANGTLCGDVNLKITGNDLAATVYYNGPLSGAVASANLKTGAASANPNNTNWSTGDTGTYTFLVTLPDLGPGNNPNDMADTCTASVTWSQTNA